MHRKRPLPENYSGFETLTKKAKTNDRDKMLASDRETVLKELSEVEHEAEGHESLSEKLENFRTQVENVLQRHENEIKRLNDEIDDDRVVLETQKNEIKRLKDEIEDVRVVLKRQDNEIKRLNDEKDDNRVVLEREKNEIKRLYAKTDDLTKELDNLKRERKELTKTFAIAQATWAWEAHLTRFVINSKEEMWEYDKLGQMNEYLRTVKKERNLWTKIMRRIGFREWTKDHRKMVKTVRNQRNVIAHPQFIDLDVVKAEIKTKKMGPIYGPAMLDMLDVLKMTASLMKFGRLAKLYKDNKRYFPGIKLNRAEEKVLEIIISWDRRFEDIHGLQNIKHEEAKAYLKMYVKDSEKIAHYFRVVDLIKKENGKKLGKWASELKKSNVSNDEERDVVEELEKLAPKDPATQEKRGSPRNLRNYEFATMANLHVPD